MDPDYTRQRDQYLRLFGLSEDFSAGELGAAYRTLAKLNHPDVNRDMTSSMRMAIVNEGHRFLLAHLGVRGEVRGMEQAGLRGAGGVSRAVRDVPYETYRRAFSLLKTAFEEYYGETGDRSNAGNGALLRERLAKAREDFSRIVADLPYSEWVDDAIDRINSINKWLF
jgi:curved DNA-binding protein CbpA